MNKKSDEQLFCSKCGNTNWSQWFTTCNCKEPDFRFKTYAEYEQHNKQQLNSRNPHCLDCGSQLESLNVSESVDKYLCKPCNKHWFKTRRVIVEWTSGKVEDNV